MALSSNQKRRIAQLERYLSEVKTVEKTDFDGWFAGRKEFCVNIGAYLILIKKDK